MNRKIFAILTALLLTGMVLISGCDKKTPQTQESPSDPSSSAPGLTKPGADSGGQAPRQFTSTGLDLSFEYPGDWSVEEGGNSVIVTSPANQNCAIMIADISYEVSLFLAGRGDMENSIDALVDKYADSLAGDSTKGNYDYSWDQTDSGNIQAKASFTYSAGSGTYQGLVDVEQIGSRVFLSAVISPDDNRREAASAAYGNLNATFQADGTGGTLEPANLSDLGFPVPPRGFEQFYSPVTGQYFIYPDDWTMVNNVHDSSVILVNDSGALMLTENWTDTFFEHYNSNGNDLEDCFDEFLIECEGALETIYGEVPRYRDFQLMSTKNQELIKATFNYTVSAGTGRCFAELGVREFGGKEYVQATLCLYKVGDSYSIDLFSIIMDSIMIYYPAL